MINFEDTMYYDNFHNATDMLESEAMRLGIYYKLVDIGWCAQVHPDS